MSVTAESFKKISNAGAAVVVRKLDGELSLLRSAMSKIDLHSGDPGDQWALPIYEKAIQRRERWLRELNG